MGYFFARIVAFCHGFENKLWVLELRVQVRVYCACIFHAASTGHIFSRYLLPSATGLVAGAISRFTLTPWCRVYHQVNCVTEARDRVVLGVCVRATGLQCDVFFSKQLNRLQSVVIKHRTVAQNICGLVLL